MLYIFNSFFLVLLEVLCCVKFFESFGERKETSLWKNFRIIGMLIFVVLLISICLKELFMMKEIIIVFITALIMSTHIKISFLKSLVFSFLFQGLLLVVDYFIYLICTHIFFESSELSVFYFIQASLIVIFGKCILMLVVLLVRKLIKVTTPVLMIDMEWSRFIIFPIFTICIIAYMISTSELIHIQKRKEIYIITAFGLAGINIVVFYLIHDILKHEVNIHKNELFRLQIENQMNLFNSVSESYDQQRKQMHEYKNQIECIDALLKRNRYKELREYVQKIRGKFREKIDIIQTTHVIVDAILNTKYQEMLLHDIIFIFQLNDLSDLNMDDEDLIIILSNLLNNAIEACEQCQCKKVIKLKFVREEEVAIISCKNTYEHEIIYKNNQIQTSKQNNLLEHGLGIKNIIETVKKYNGYYAMREYGSEFQFSIMIPLYRNEL